MSAMGYPRPTTPHLDRWMARGTRFDWAFATASFTVPSHVSIFTGLDPSFTSTGLENGQKFALDTSYTTLAEMCSAAGMYTAAVVSSDTLMRKVGLDQGFADYEDAIHWKRSADQVRGGLVSKGKQPADIACTKAAVKIRKAGERPYFVWLHLMDPHGPYVPPPGWVERVWGNSDAVATGTGRQVPPPRSNRDSSGLRSIPYYQFTATKGTDYDDYVRRYDAAIAFTDDELGKMLDELEAQGKLRDTLVVITSDHGEALGEDEFFFAHSQSVGVEQVRVPLAFIGPGVAAGRVITTPVSNMDIFATVCDALGLDGRTGRDSASLAGVLTASSSPAGRAAYFAAQSQRGVARDDRYYRRDRAAASDENFWKFNYNSGGPHRPCGEQFLELPSGRPLAAVEGAEIKAALDAYWPRAEAALVETPRNRLVNRSVQEKKALENLGYLVDDDGDEKEKRR